MKNLLFKIFSSLLAILLISNCDDREDAFKIVPVANFTVSDSIIDVNGNVQFTDNSIYSPSSWSWDFGDNITSDEKDPSHTYTNAGTYKVRLIVSNEYGSDSAIHYIIVSEAGKAPIASFIVSDSIIKVGHSVTFTDKSANNPSNWLWEFGDGFNSTIKEPSYAYENIGIYAVKLTVTNSYGSDTLTKYIKVGNAPVANFSATPTTITTGESVQFSDSSTNNPTSWKWDFGDGNTSPEKSPSYKYNTDGIFSVKLTIKNSFGTDSITRAEYIVVEDPIIDADGNTYKKVTIGTQVWMVENLKTTKYNDGTPIPNVTDSAKWVTLTTSAYCWYDNDSATYKNTYGALYNWHTVNTGKLCPSGWHVPIDAEWTQLSDYLGSSSVVGGKLKEIGTAHWGSPNTGATNETGFTALPGGYRSNDGSFLNNGYFGYWWSATEYSTTSTYYQYLSYGSSYVRRGHYSKEFGCSVRCVRD